MGTGGDEVIIESEDPVYVKHVDGQAQLPLEQELDCGHRDSVTIAYFTTCLTTIFIAATCAELYEMVGRNKPGRDVQEAIQWATVLPRSAARELDACNGMPTLQEICRWTTVKRPRPFGTGA